jgi:ABC-2 type transport system permease protein
MSTFLRQWRLVATREFRALLASPLFYVLSGIFFLLTSLIYVGTLLDFAKGGEDSTVNVTVSVVRPTFHMIHFFLLVQIPLLTMRVFAEDRSGGMLDLLQTTPVRDWALLLGKFTGTLGALSLYILMTALFPLITALLGQVEWPVVIGSLLALLASAAAYVAVGLLFSALTESQVVAAVLSYVTIFLLVFSQALVESTRILPLQEALRHFAVMEHVSAILNGNIALMNAVYFVSLTSVFLFLTARALEARRWRA